MNRWTLAILAGSMLLAPSAVEAQAAVGLRAGLRSAELASNQADGSLRRLVIGSYVGFGISNRIALQIEAVYGTRGAESIHIEDGRLDLDASPLELTMDYVEIPVLLRVGFPGERLLPSFFVGPYAGFLLDCDLTAADGTTTACDEEGASQRFDPRATDFGLVAGAGLDVAFGENTLFIDARYTTALLSIQGGDSPFDARHNGFAVSGGFAVPLTR